MTKPNLRIGVIGDPHHPYVHPKYLGHCVKTFDDNRCNLIICVGDVADNHSISYHEKNTSLPGPDDELALTRKSLQAWVKAFPKLKVCIGNHDELPARKSRTAGLPSLGVLGYNAYYQTPGWDWQREHVIPAFHHQLWFRHSWQKSIMQRGGTGGYSVICGHTHTESGVRWAQFPSHSTFSLYTGCGILASHPAFDYGRDNGNQPVMSCATIIDGQPHIHRMFV